MSETADPGVEASVGESVEASVGEPIISRTVSVAGRRIAYREYGDPAGQPVVLLHGTPGSSRFGGLFAPAAADAGVRLLAIDRPGYGDSDPWPTRTLTDIGGVVAGVLDDAGVQSAGVVGFSGGGPHALAVAATQGDRVTSVDLVSGSTPPTGDSPAMQRLLAGLAASAPRLLGGLFRMQSWIATTISPAFLSQYTDREIETFDPALVELLTAEFVEAVGGSGQAVATEFRLLAREWGFPPEEIDQPVRFWHGEADTNVPIVGVEKLSQRVPTSELTRLPGGDHLTTVLDCRTQVIEAHT